MASDADIETVRTFLDFQLEESECRRLLQVRNGRMDAGALSDHP
jgi:hypothetical protein